MKIAVSSSGPAPDDAIDPRFGRCTHFLLFAAATMACEAHPNPGLTDSKRMGIKAANFLVENGVSVVITGEIGPNAQEALKTAGIHTVTGVNGPALQAVQKFISGSLAAGASG